MHASIRLFVLFAALSLASPLYAAEITTGSNDPEKIVKRGQTTTGCPEPGAKTKEPIAGKWLALTDRAIQHTVPFVVNGRVTSNSRGEKYYFTNISLQVGPVPIATITKMRTGTTAPTEYDIKLNSSRYRFIEWGSFGFAIKTLSPLGRTLATEVYGSENQRIPREAYSLSKEGRDSYDPGWVEIERAGDFNGDGVLDLLLRYQSKEAEGLTLWLSDPGSGKHLEPIVAATAYGDC